DDQDRENHQPPRRDLGSEALQSAALRLRHCTHRFGYDEQARNRHGGRRDHGEHARRGQRGESGDPPGLPAGDKAEDQQRQAEDEFAGRPCALLEHAVLRNRIETGGAGPGRGRRGRWSRSCYGRGISKSSGERSVAPLSCSTQVVTDCHLPRNSSASSPEMFIMTLPRLAISVVKDSDSAPTLKASTSLALT